MNSVKIQISSWDAESWEICILHHVCDSIMKALFLPVNIHLQLSGPLNIHDISLSNLET